MATETTAPKLVAISGSPKDPEELIRQVRRQIKMLTANLSVLQREVGIETATLPVEIPGDKGVDKAKLDQVLAREKPASGRILLLSFLLESEKALVDELKRSHHELYLDALRTEYDELTAACKKECEQPAAELKQEIDSMEPPELGKAMVDLLKEQVRQLTSFRDAREQDKEVLNERIKALWEEIAVLEGRHKSIIIPGT